MVAPNPNCRGCNGAGFYLEAETHKPMKCTCMMAGDETAARRRTQPGLSFTPAEQLKMRAEAKQDCGMCKGFGIMRLLDASDPLGDGRFKICQCVITGRAKKRLARWDKFGEGLATSASSACGSILGTVLALAVTYHWWHPAIIELLQHVRWAP